MINLKIRYSKPNSNSVLGSAMKGAFHGGLIGAFWMTGFYMGFQISDEEYKREIKKIKDPNN